jgi:hypothetical protein
MQVLAQLDCNHTVPANIASAEDRRPAHMHTISSAKPQKVTLAAVLSLCSEAEVQARLHIRSARPRSFFLPNCPIQQLMQPTLPLSQKLLPQKTHNPKNNNANPHAHNLKIKIASFLKHSRSS